MSIQVLLTRQDGQTMEIPVERVTWSGSKTTAPRSVTVDMVATNRGLHQFIEPHEGNGITFLWQGQELFSGYEFKRSRTKAGTLNFTAYDNLIYLAKNSDSYVFTAKKASEILQRICADFQISVGDIADTGYVIPTRVYDGKNLYEIVMDALNLTYQHTGVRYYLSSTQDKVNLVKRPESPRKWVIEDGINLIDYSYESSIEDTITKVKLEAGHEAGEEKKTIIAQSQNGSLMEQLGVLQHYEKVSDNLNQAQLQKRADQILANKGIVNKSFSLDALGLPGVISGGAVHVICQDLGLKKGYYIDADTHNFQGHEHTMNLTLVETDELPEIDAGGV